MDRVHDLVPGLQDGGNLHVVLAVGQLPANLFIHVFQRQHHKALLVLLVEMGDDGDIAVGSLVFPLAEQLCLRLAGFPGLP